MALQSHARELIRQGDALFDARASMMDYWQDAAEQFYPERADFTQETIDGDDLAGHLTSSVPILNRRDLGDLFSSMLRPWNLDWFEVVTGGNFDDTPADAKEWLEEKQATQKNAMQDRVAGFDRAAKEADHGYVTFGQWPIKVEINYRDQAILVRARHLKNVAWCDDFTGQTYKVHERMRLSAWQLSQQFPEKKLHKEVLKALVKDPQKTFECRQVVLPVDAYDRLKPKDEQKFRKTKFVSLIVDVENEHLIEEAPSVTLKYVIPRWQTFSGSQYSYSPATVAALPDARLFQQMTLSMLEAGEMAARPPVFIAEEIMRGDMNYFAGGVSSFPDKYAEKGMTPIHYLRSDKSGFGHGMEMLDRVRMVLRESWYLNRLRLPVQGPEVTAYEFSERMKEFVRDSMTLFAPAETEYNAPLCETIFEEMMAYGFMGPPDEIPDSLKGEDIKFRFRSPFRDAEDRKNTGSFMEGLGVIERTLAFDPGAGQMADLRKGLKTALEGIEWPQDWFFDEEEIEARTAALEEKQAMAEGMAAVGQGAAIAEQAGNAGVAIKEAMA